ncbi:MAG: copper resistance protein CopC/CopD [Caldilineaceae bacterium]|nr:copper resistance protein CopC/CopD [Caldilineaceae bacterium]
MHKRFFLRSPLFGGLLALLVGSLLVIQSARAHALLVRSVPAAGAAVAIAPATIELWFSEPIEPDFSQAYLVDLQGNELGRGAATVDPADPMHLTLPLAPLDPGIYTVVYHNLSAADGHEWVGSFPLTILNPDGTSPGDATGLASGRGPQGDEWPSPLKALSRWLALVGAMCLTGGVAFRRLLLGWRTLPDPAAEPSLLRLERTLQLALVVCVGAVLIGSWLQVIAQMATLQTASSSGGAALDLFFRTRAGTVIVIRQLATGLLLFLAIVAVGAASTLRAGLQWLVLALSLVVLATFSASSHAAAVPGSIWAMTVDWIHLAAASVWLGGLLLLAVLLWQARQVTTAAEATLLRQLARRFSVAATLAVFVLAVTGLFSTLVQVQSLAVLWRTPYGWLLLGKLALVALVLGIAWFNHRWVRTPSATAAWSAGHYRTFQRQVWRESLAGLALMVVVAFLVQTPVPPPSTSPAPTALFETVLTADDLTAHLQISPNQVGENRYTVHLYHADGSPIGEVQLVRLLFVHQTAELGQSSLELAPQDGDIFTSTGAYQNRAGPWDLSLYVRRRGLDDLLLTTVVAVPPLATPLSAARSPWQNPIATLPAAAVVGGVVVTCLLLPLVWRRAKQQVQ